LLCAGLQGKGCTRERLVCLQGSWKKHPRKKKKVFPDFFFSAIPPKIAGVYRGWVVVISGARPRKKKLLGNRGVGGGGGSGHSSPRKGFFQGKGGAEKEIRGGAGGPFPPAKFRMDAFSTVGNFETKRGCWFRFGEWGTTGCFSLGVGLSFDPTGAKTPAPGDEIRITRAWRGLAFKTGAWRAGQRGARWVKTVGPLPGGNRRYWGGTAIYKRDFNRTREKKPESF